MPKDIFPLLNELETAFLHLPEQGFPQEALDRYIDSFPHDDIRQHATHIPSLFYRLWIHTCLSGHHSGLTRLQALLKQGKSKREIHLVHDIAYLWLGHARRLFERENYFYTQYNECSVNEFVIKPEDLNIGDVVLSYKTKKYLLHSPLSLFIKFITRSSITHVMVACHDAGTTPRLLMSDDTTKGLGIIGAVTDPGEVLIVLEPTPHPRLHEIPSEIRRLRRLAEKKDADPELRRFYDFPELKCEAACVIGFMYVTSGLIRRKPISLKNPLRNWRGTFCSELVDYIFKTADIRLTPRSEHHAIVGPVEFFYSPRLRMKGLIGDPATIEQTKAELRQKIGGTPVLVCE